MLGWSGPAMKILPSRCFSSAGAGFQWRRRTDDKVGDLGLGIRLGAGDEDLTIR